MTAAGRVRHPPWHQPPQSDSEAIVIRPTVFGYRRVQLAAADRPWPAPSSRKDLEDFAEREGFALAQCFTDAGDTGPFLALGSLIEAADFTEVVAVLVPHLSHLGSTPTAQEATLDRLRAASLPVVAVTCTDLQRSGVAAPPPTSRF